MIATRGRILARPACCLALCVLALAGLVPLTTAAEETPGPRVRKDLYGRMPDGTAVDLYTLSNAHGLEARIMTLGATLVTFQAPDRNGKMEIITLHKEPLVDYLREHPLLGSVVGRYANRIAGAAFTIDGREYRLDANAGQHQLHGGKEGFHRLVWQAEPLHEPDAAGVRLRLDSADGQGGYPGRLQVTMVYKLTADNRLVMDYTATTDRPTHVNLTNHAYWNLGGAAGGDVPGHVLLLEADRYLPTDEALIPTGEIRGVRGTPLDFTLPRTIGGRIDQLPRRHYDDCYVLRRKGDARLGRAARVVEPASGRTMEVWTTQPGVQLYTGNPRGLCLETQHYPDTPHHPNFPSTLLRPGETFHETTEHRFGVLDPRANLGFPLVDYHVHLDNSTIDKVLELSRERGVQFGIVEHAGTKENKYPVVLSNDAELDRQLAMLAGKPVFRGVQAEWTDWRSGFSPAGLARLDYVLMDAMTFPGRDGSRVKLWEDDAASRVDLADPQAFMERYVDWYVEILRSQPIDILANASWLPKPLEADYEACWTPARIRQVVQAMVEHRVALEISSSLRLPKLNFLEIARDAGVKFSFGSNGRYPNMGELDYCREAAQILGLTKDQVFTPPPDGQKAVQRWKHKE